MEQIELTREQVERLIYCVDVTRKAWLFENMSSKELEELVLLSTELQLKLLKKTD